MHAYIHVVLSQQSRPGGLSKVDMAGELAAAETESRCLQEGRNDTRSDKDGHFQIRMFAHAPICTSRSTAPPPPP